VFACPNTGSKRLKVTARPTTVRVVHLKALDCDLSFILPESSLRPVLRHELMLPRLALRESSLVRQYRLRPPLKPLTMYSLRWKYKPGRGTSTSLAFRLIHLHFTPCIRLFWHSTIPLYVLRQRATVVIHLAF